MKIIKLFINKMYTEKRRLKSIQFNGKRRKYKKDRINTKNNRFYKIGLIAILSIIIVFFKFNKLNKPNETNEINKPNETNKSNAIQIRQPINDKENKTKLEEEISKFKSFSEYYEDLILYILLFEIKNGFYIDIGAFDPNFVSVTKAFYLRGWNGINIEPLPDKINSFIKERPKDTNLQIVIGQNEGNITFYINGQCSTIKKNYAKTNQTINIKMDSMRNICKRYVPEGKDVDFCKIDVEGGERDVLLGYDFVNYKPKVFCVESTIPMSFTPNHQLWEEILINNDYTFVFQHKVNRFYVNNNFPEILERGKNIRKYFRKHLL